MTIATRKVAMPPKAAPARTSELRKALSRIKADTDEAVLLFPDADANLAKLRNRASGAVSALKKDGMHFVTRTAEAVPPGSDEGTEPVKCVGIWRVSEPEDAEGTNGEKVHEPAGAAQKTEAKPAAPKAKGNGKAAAAKSEPKADSPEQKDLTGVFGTE